LAGSPAAVAPETARAEEPAQSQSRAAAPKAPEVQASVAPVVVAPAPAPAIVEAPPAPAVSTPASLGSPTSLPPLGLEAKSAASPSPTGLGAPGPGLTAFPPTSGPALMPVGPSPPTGPAQASGPRQNNEAPTAPRLMGLADAAYDVLRGSSDGRPIHFRQIAEIALKRRLLRGELVDVARAMRGALVREQRQRDSDGLRPRIRNLGQGQFALGERKLEPDLYGAERDLLDRLNRTREATRVALRRRLRTMPPGPFELFMRLLLERIGMVGAELVKRGEGVAYYGGLCSRGSRSPKVLCAIRPGEAEVSREAVGELRAGMRLRGYDEGLMLCSARLSSAALAEAGAAPGIDVYDQDALTDLLVRHQLGVRRMQLPIDYVDTELFNELLDQT
jgi:hypothetical protein